MALLTPNTVYQMNNVTIKEKIIPDGNMQQRQTQRDSWQMLCIKRSSN